MSWLGTQFKDRFLFRRILLVSVMGMAWRVTEWSLSYADNAIDKPGSDVALVIGAVAVPTMTLFGFVTKDYTFGRKNANISN